MAAPTGLMTTELQAELATLINALGAFITQHAANIPLLPATTVSAPIVSGNSGQPSPALPQPSALVPQGRRLIQMRYCERPRGTPGRRGDNGWQLRETLGLSHTSHKYIRSVVKNHIERHLDVTQTFTSQSRRAVTQVVKEVLEEIPEFRGYKDPFWPIEAYIYTSLKSSRDCHKRLLKALQMETEQAKENRPMEQARGFVSAEFEQAIGNTGSTSVGDRNQNPTIVTGTQTVRPSGFAAWASAPRPFIPATSLNVPTAPLAFAPPVAPSSLHKAVAGIKSNGQLATAQMASNSKAALSTAGTSSSDWLLPRPNAKPSKPLNVNLPAMPKPVPVVDPVLLAKVFGTGDSDDLSDPPSSPRSESEAGPVVQPPAMLDKGKATVSKTQETSIGPERVGPLMRPSKKGARHKLSLGRKGRLTI